jgi:hypothetical protein
VFHLGIEHLVFALEVLQLMIHGFLHPSTS